MHLRYLAWFAHPVFAALSRCSSYGLSGGGQGVVDRTVSPDGRHELVVEHWQAVIDDAYDVKLRSRQGLLSREVLVCRDVDALQPAARFTGTGEIEIVTDAELAASERELYRSSFDPGTLRLSAFHCLSPGYC